MTNIPSASSTVLAAFRDEFRLRASMAQFSKNLTNLSPGTPTDFINVRPLHSDASTVLASELLVSVTLTASAAVAPNTGHDQMSALFTGGSRVEVYPASNTAPRSTHQTRKFYESMEKFTWDQNFLGASATYPRAALPTFTAAGSSTFVLQLYVPVGGPAAAVRLYLPTAAAVAALYATPADITGVEFNYVRNYTVDGNNSTVVAFNETLTPSLGSGMQTIEEYFPKTLQPEIVFMLGESSSTINSLYAVAQDGTVLYNTPDLVVVSTAATMLCPITGSDPNALDIAALGNGFLQLQVNYVSATTHNLGFAQYAGGETTNPASGSAETASLPAVQSVGTPTSTGSVAPAGNAAPGPGSPGGGAHLIGTGRGPLGFTGVTRGKFSPRGPGRGGPLP